MKKTIAVAALALTMTASSAMAGERGGDAALGALSGAIVLGPVGAVAGALVGYTAGPDIAQSWGLRRSRTVRRAPQTSPQRSSAAPSRSQLAQGTQPAEPRATQATQAPPARNAAPPPVQTLE